MEDYIREYIIRETSYPFGNVKQEKFGELVRCKDCKHMTYCYSEVHMTNRLQTTSICKDIDFCSYAERRTDE